MRNAIETRKPRNFRQLLASTCLATGLVAAPAAAQDVIEIGVDLGNGKDTGNVAGGTAIAAGGADVLGIGVSAGNGADDITNIGLIFVDVDASQISFLPLGPVGAAGLFANAVGYGLYGDNGPDTLVNADIIVVDVAASGFLTNTGLTVLGAPNYVAPSLVSAHGGGIEGGNLYDIITNNGDVTVNVVADMTMVGQTPSFFGGETGIDVAAEASAIGLNGTTELLTTANNGLLDLTATANAALVTLDIEVVNGFKANTEMAARADVVGIAGDEIIESLENAGDIRGAANASATRGAGLVSASDGGVSEAAVAATAIFTGVRAEGEADTVINTGAMDIAANAAIDSVDVEINVFDVAGGSFALSPFAEATGIDGGWGDDALSNAGRITSTAASDITSVGVNLSLIDVTAIGGRIASLVDTGAPEGPEIQSLARGLAGGDGADTLTNEIGGLIEVYSDAGSYSTEISVAAAGIPDAIFAVTFDGDRLASLDTAALAEIAGMEGGAFADVIDNRGALLGEAAARAQQIGVAVSAPVSFLPDAAGVLPGFTMGGAGALADAGGAGMTGGDGADNLDNTGVIGLQAIADANAVGVSVEMPDLESSEDKSAVDISFTMADVATESYASIAGMAGDGGDDIVRNLGGVVVVGADADASSTGVGVTGAFENKGVIAEGIFTRGTSLADANAAALDGGEGGDVLENTGFASAAGDANAQSDSVSVILAGLTQGASLGVAAIESGADAKSDVRTLSGGAGDDVITNAGIANAVSLADAGAVGVTVGITGVAQTGFAGSGALVRTGASATADAAALVGGDGDDTLENTGFASADADAIAATDSVGVAFAAASNGGAIGVAAVDAASDATANALAVSGGDGADSFVNAGVIDADANASASAVGVSVGISGIANAGLAGAGALSRTGATATSNAAGVDWNGGDQGAENAGAINTKATSVAESASVGVSLSGATNGLVLGATLLDAGTIAESNAAGFRAPDGDNAITNYSALSSIADATANSDSVGVTVGLALNAGAVGGFSMAKADTDATANAGGLVTDLGVDEIENFGLIDSVSIARANSLGVSVALNGAMTGVAINAALADVSGGAAANAGAVSTGALDDSILSNGELIARADGLAAAGSVAVEIAGANAGLSGGAAWTKADIEGLADARAVRAGGGDDTVDLAGSVDAIANAEATAASVSVGLQGAVTGVTVGASLVEAESRATSFGAAVDLGDGDDRLNNFAAIAAAATADAGSTGVAINVGATGTGLSISGSLADTSSDAAATAAAVIGGFGADEINNNARLDADAIADARATNVNVALSGSITGVAASGALSDATVNASAMATGIAGDVAPSDAAAPAGADNADTILSANVIDAYAEANSDGTAVTVNVPVAFVPIGAALTTAATMVDAVSYGIDGGLGGDVIGLSGDLISTSRADAGGVAVNAALAGFVLGDISADAGAFAYGVEGGAGGDEIVSLGRIWSDAGASAGGTSVNVTLAGGAVGALHTAANADAYGISGGAGSDIVHVRNAVSSLAASEVDSVLVTAELAGFSLDDAYSEANALAIGVDGGDGDDQLVTQSSVHASADADISSVDVGVVLIGALLNDASAKAHAEARGAAGGGGADTIEIVDAVTSVSTASAGNVGVNVSLVGGAGSQAGIGANALAYGVDGGGGGDAIHVGAAIDASAAADVSGTSVDVAIVGANFAASDIAAEALARAVAGGAGDDGVVLDARVSADAHAVGGGVAVGVNGAGFQSVDASTSILADARGADGGAGADAIQVNDIIEATATAEIKTVSVNVGLVGGIDNNAASVAEADAAGVAGGAGADLVEINGDMTVLADALADGANIAVELVGGVDADLSATAIATAAGVDGGEDDDTIFNNASLSVTAEADADANNVTVEFVGAALADANVTADATAIGVTGGGGNDAIVNDGAITTLAKTTTDSDNVQVALVSGAVSEANTTGAAHAAGIDAGEGDDFVAHSGAINSTARAVLEAGNVNVGLAGGSISDIRMSAATLAEGIAAGAGDDDVLTEAGSTMTVLGQITGNANSANIELIGAAIDKTVLGYTVEAAGVSTGDGDDDIVLAGDMDIDAKTSFTLSSTQVTLLGAGFESSRIAADAYGVGLAGGAGADRAHVSGHIDVFAESVQSSAGSTRFNLAGYTSSTPRFGAFATAVGADLGTGDDVFGASSAIKSYANARSTIGGSSISIFGANNAGGSLGARANARGVLGGGGDDVIVTSGLIDVDAIAASTLQSIGFSFIGATSVGGAITVGANAIGHGGGAGEDAIANQGSLYAYARADVTSSSANATSFGASSSDTTTVAESISSGILGDGDDDTLINSGLIDSRARSYGDVTRSSFTFAGASSAGATASANSFAYGMRGGEGDDIVVNDGSVYVDAYSDNDASANTTSFIGTAKASSRVNALARATGLDGNSGADGISNTGSLTVVATANADSTNAANTGGFFIDNRTNSVASSSARAIGIDGSSGENTVWNSGSLEVDILGTARTESRSDGDVLDNIFGLDLDAFAYATSFNDNQDARGVSAGGDTTVFVNDGDVDVRVAGHGYAYANADGDAFASGDGTASASVSVDGGRAYGFVAGSGDHRVQNNGVITVLSRPTGNADSISDADGIDTFVQPDSRATSSVTVNSARAAGLWVSAGDDIIENFGAINVTAAPQANKAEADAGFGGDVIGVDGFATATASANDATAYGVRDAGGENWVYNAGTIIALASPNAVADAVASGVGIDGDATARATANAKNAVAYGVLTGDGDDFIWNDGSITARSAPSASASATANQSESAINEGEEVETESASISGRAAYAVLTADGDDVVVNNGSIIATLGSSVGAGAAILTGDGVDFVALLDGSETRGTVDLGGGNDTLLLNGAFASSSTPTGGSGFDTVIFDGAGSNGLSPASFEQAAKTGGGVFNTFSLSQMQSLDMQSGTLRVLSPFYSMAPGGSFTAFVDGDGTFGQFAVNGLLTLGGDAFIKKGANLFADGQSFDVATAPSLAGSFASVALPAATPLLSFSSSQSASAFTVTANVASFASVAEDDESTQAFAAQLDEAAGLSGGRLEALLTEMQHADEDYDFAGAIASLNPANFEAFTAATAQSLDQMESGVRQRLATLRAAQGGAAGFVPGAEALRFDAGDQTPISERVTSGVWRAEFGAPLVSTGESAGVITGVDYLIGGDALIGASMGAVRSVSPGAIAGDRQVQSDNTVFSVYGSKLLGEHGYLDGVFTYGEQDGRASQAIAALEDFRSGAVLDHAGQNLSFSLEAGRAFRTRAGGLEIYGGLRYRGIAEHGVDFETAGVNYSVEKRLSQSLDGEIGARFGWETETALGVAQPRVTMAWRHRFDVAGNRIAAVFEDAPEYTFILPGEAFADNRIMVGGAIDLAAGGGWSLSARFEGDVLDSFETKEGVLELAIPF